MKSFVLLASSLVLPLPLLPTTPLQAQTPKLLKDLNRIPVSSSSMPRPALGKGKDTRRSFDRFGKGILFSATVEGSGTELWLSGGTPATTRLLKDINPGVDSSDPGAICVTNDGKRVFFAANDGKTGRALWITDGTRSGTVRVTGFASGPMGSGLWQIVAVGPRSVIFTAYAKVIGYELFISDGTSKGTTLLKDVLAGFQSGSPTQFCASRDGKIIFFSGTTYNQGAEPWITDGTTAGTKMLKDIYPGYRTSYPAHPVPLGQSRILFEANDGVNGQELWVTDGTTKGTKIPVKLSPGKYWAAATTRNAVALGDKVIFRAWTAGKGQEVYVTDGTPQGTMLLIDAFPGPSSGSWGFLPHVGSQGKKVYWAGYKSWVDQRIFVSDGTPAGTKVFTPKSVEVIATGLVESLGKVYFQTRNLTPGTGSELCVSDGTMAGTKTLRDTYKGPRSGYANYLTRLTPATVLFAADDGLTGKELWSMTGGRSFQRMDLNKPKGGPTQSAHPRAIACFGKYVLFSATDGWTQSATWISDGTAAGTTLLKDLTPLTTAYTTRSYAVAGDKLVFESSTPSTGIELFVTDGTRSGTSLLKDINPGPASSKPGRLFSIGDKVYFSCNDGSTGDEPWVTDGTKRGTTLLKDLAPGAGGSFPDYFAGQGDKVVFQAFSTASGSELYLTDGTVKGTGLLKDIYPGTSSSYPASMTYSAGKVYFRAWDPKHRAELWVTDFTNKGTTLVKDLSRGSSAPRDLNARNGKIYFSAYTPATGRELFVSDGTAAGTRLFLDYAPGAASSNLKNISAIGSRKIYFSAKTTTQGEETIVTDGTPTGTTVIDIYPGPGSGLGYFDNYFGNEPDSRVTLGSQVFMRGNHPLYGEEVFTVDNGATAEPIGTPYGSTWLQGSDPVLNGVATITGGTGLANAAHVLIFGAPAARPMRLGNAGCAHFDLRSYFGITAVTTGKRFGQSFAIPGDASLKGVQIVFQTLSFDTTKLADTLELSNGLHWAVGN